jgi:hypothetical protein
MLGEDEEEENCEPKWVVVKMVVAGLHEREEETDVATSAISEAHKSLLLRALRVSRTVCVSLCLLCPLACARERAKRSACVLLEEEETTLSVVCSYRDSNPQPT